MPTMDCSTANQIACSMHLSFRATHATRFVIGWADLDWSDKPCITRFADDVASPAGLNALHVYVISVSSMVTDVMLIRAVSLIRSMTYLSDGYNSQPDTSHFVSGSGRPVTLHSSVAVSFKVTGWSLRGSMKDGFSKSNVRVTVHSVEPHSFIRRMVYSPWSSCLTLWIVNVTVKSSVTVMLEIRTVL